jgi:hypothetical protein
MQVDERIVPKELVVGISGDLCYMTYYETKGKITDLNSKNSWTSWSSNAKKPLIVENKFMSGFKLAGVNGRWSRNASNSENMLIMHPAFKKSFEISMSRFMEIAKYSVITNGVFDQEFIVTKSRDIVSLDEYNALIKDHDKQDKAKNKKETALKASKISTKDQIPSRVYKDAKNGKYFLYLGSMTVTNSKGTSTKYVYLDDVKTATESVQYSNYDFQSDERTYGETRECPSLLHWWYGSDIPTVWTLTKSYRITVLNNKKQISLSELSDTDMFENYSDEDWNNIERLYNEVIQPNRYGGFDGWYKEQGTPKINFRQDYLDAKAKNAKTNS